MTDKKYCWQIIFVWTALGIIALPVIYAFYWLYWPMQALEYKEVKVLKATVCPGEFLEYQVVVTKHIDVPGILYRQLVSVDDNNYVINLPSAWGKLPVGTHTIVGQVPIPAEIKSGKYIVRSTTIHPVHFLRSIETNYTIPEFEIKQSKECE